MSIQAPNWFAPQYSKRVIQIYQAKGNKLRPMVKQAGRVDADKAYWRLTGEGEAYEKQRNTRARPMNPDRTKVEGTLITWEALDTVEEFDLDRLDVNEREEIYKTGAMALGRSTDKKIYDVIDAAAPRAGDRYINASAGAFSITHALTMIDVLQDSIEEWDGEVYCGLPSRAWNQFLSWKQVNSADYVGGDLPYTKMTDTRRWNGVNWFLIPKRFLPQGAADTRDVFMWHKEAVGWGNNTDLRTIPAWDNYMSWWTINMQSKGCPVVLQEKGLVRCRVSLTSAITAN